MEIKKVLAAVALALVLVLSLVGCGATGHSAGSSGGGESSSTSASASSSAKAKELAGKPWVTSLLSGNLPDERPEAKDDLYTYYCYDYIASHQGNDAMLLDDTTVELREANTAVIKDSSKTSHELEQLRIFYNQAADLDALKKAGLSEIQPYLDRVDAVTSIGEMNALLSAEDFPFCPFIVPYVNTDDTRANNIVAIEPNFVLFDIATGAEYYQDGDDPQVQEARVFMVELMETLPMLDLSAAGMDQYEAYGAATDIADFEKAHGRFATGDATYLKRDFGALAEDVREDAFTLDELCALCPNFPMRETLQNCGKAGSETYVVEHKWLEAFNACWTEENLDVIKLAAKAKILGETRPFRDPSAMDGLLMLFGQPPTDPDEFAYAACDELDTFSQVLAKTYVEETLGQDAKDRLKSLSEDLIKTYKDSVNQTAWLGEESKQRVLDKLDHMTLNVLEPAGGYFDYSGLELTPSDQGGTLFSNYLKLKQYRLDCESAMIGKPAVPASVWFVIKPTYMNAFYDPGSNSINIFPGFVTSVVYADEMDDAALLGGAGYTIGHEISHSFDYQGAQLDAYGQPNPVLADEDVDNFVSKSAALARYYSGIEMTPGMKVDGQRVVGEAAADLCGMQAILELAGKVKDFDYEEFYRSTALMWATVLSRELFPVYAIDVHALSNMRVNVNAQMFQEFYDAFGVKEGDGMYLAPEDRIAIWGPNA